jgi:hypothetical protein
MGDDFLDFDQLMPDMFASPDYDEWMPLSHSPASTDFHATVAHIFPSQRVPTGQCVDLSASLGISKSPPKTPTLDWLPVAQQSKHANIEPLPFIDDTMVGNYSCATATAPLAPLLHSPSAGVLQRPRLISSYAESSLFNFPSLPQPDAHRTPCIGGDENIDPFCAFKSFLMQGSKGAPSYHTPMPFTEAHEVHLKTCTHAGALDSASTPTCFTGAADANDTFSFIPVCGAQPATPRLGSASHSGHASAAAPRFAKALPVFTPLAPETPAHTSAITGLALGHACLSLTIDAGSSFTRVRCMLQQGADSITCVQQAREHIRLMNQGLAASMEKISQKSVPGFPALTAAGAATPPYKKLLRHLNPGQDSPADAHVLPTPEAFQVQAPSASETRQVDSINTGHLARIADAQQPCCMDGNVIESPESAENFQVLVRNIKAACYESPAVPGELNPGHIRAAIPKMAAAKIPKQKQGIPPPSGNGNASKVKSSKSPVATSPLNPFSALVRNIQAARYESPAVRQPGNLCSKHRPSTCRQSSPLASEVSNRSPIAAPESCAVMPMSSQMPTTSKTHTPAPTLQCPLTDLLASSEAIDDHNSSSPPLHSLHFSSTPGIDGTELSPLSGLACRSIGEDLGVSPLSCMGENSPDSCWDSDPGHATSPPNIITGVGASMEKSTCASCNAHPAAGPTCCSFSAPGLSVGSSIFSHGCTRPHLITPLVQVLLWPVLVEGGSELIQLRLEVPSSDCQQPSSITSLPHSCSPSALEQSSTLSAHHALPHLSGNPTACMEIDMSDTVVIGDITPRSPGADSPCINAGLLPIIHEDSPSFGGVFAAGSPDGVAAVGRHDNDEPADCMPPALQSAAAQEALVAPQLSASPQVPGAVL